MCPLSGEQNRPSIESHIVVEIEPNYLPAPATFGHFHLNQPNFHSSPVFLELTDQSDDFVAPVLALPFALALLSVLEVLQSQKKHCIFDI